MWTTRYLKLLTLSTSSFWTLNTTQLYFLRRLRKFGKSLKILNNFYDCVIESILTNCIIVWYGSTTVRDRKHLQRVVKTAEIIRIPLPSLQTIYQHRKAASTPPIPNMDCSNSYPQDSYSDHISVMLTLAYKPLVRHSKPVMRLKPGQGRHSESSLSTYPYLLHPQPLHPLASYPH
ncbi:hypothetical protein QTP70_013179 [Hemibagrus guttatus]|uniref:Alkylated DNA repair protein AlkB homologue 8 N-terminal domain-containing protein n=1 Tax=Hemibagrus guttatus TaxID=175788 RepID=A0AAE0V3Z8_9TELE|nr:hypothetical protein QTP70_013179 [Hemibagrus guttatus]